ncbi:FMN-dependent NADH-azoreductase [Pseudogulbenkiania subflava]|uniref:FMN dependent NADH:quinone oxidoreductase n=1 Tax=Pseudogulbenkiania subflava DSM 22618 TaxID=1123014 RepID=A0A1Y6CE14_9NEIS|nr:FMN-dependent NADH-azoreductase [Pseudogulbenkiania subflava]SMF49283.1 FMN-dependent NADH-azoreductase [Pseudogulbenkiania subflava DSM 22618]
MQKLLQLKTSLFANQGQSSQLSDAFVEAWQASHPGSQVTLRDLAVDPVPHLDAASFQSFLTKAEERTAEQQAKVEYSDTLIAELQEADVLVIGLPLYNLGVPSTLKAWIDQVARAGITFRYTANGPQGLLSGKKAYVFATRGGRYAGTAFDTQTDFVRNFLGFIGITDVEFVYAEGLNMGDESRTNSLASAYSELSRIAV